MLVVIAPEKDMKEEHGVLNALFEAGLTNFHLRKPKATEPELREYIDLIDEQYRDRIMLHSHFGLVSELGLKGYHFQEQRRLNFGDDLSLTVDLLRRQGYAVSASFHHPKEIEECDTYFDYHLLSPVFDSISKQGYAGKGFTIQNSDKLIVGMGGVNSQNVNDIYKMGYKGVGVLGGIWNHNDPVEEFRKVKSAVDKISNSCYESKHING